MRIGVEGEGWIGSAGYVRLSDAVAARGGELRLVGGAVRDALLGESWIADMDMAASLRREEWDGLALDLGIRWTAHPFIPGTVFLDGGFDDGPGRDACVSLIGDASDAWDADAARRDFTVNALSCGSDGTVRDPLGTGLVDLEARMVRAASPTSFSDDPVRIVRYPRMRSKLGEVGPDAGTAALAGAASPGLAGLQPVRLMREFCKLMSDVEDAEALARLRFLEGIGALRWAFPSADLGRLERFQEAFSKDGLMGVNFEVSRHDMARLAVLGAVREGDAWRFDSPARWGDDRDFYLDAVMDALAGGLPAAYPLRAAVVIALAELGDQERPGIAARGPAG